MRLKKTQQDARRLIKTQNDYKVLNWIKCGPTHFSTSQNNATDAQNDTEIMGNNGFSFV